MKTVRTASGDTPASDAEVEVEPVAEQHGESVDALKQSEAAADVCASSSPPREAKQAMAAADVGAGGASSPAVAGSGVAGHAEPSSATIGARLTLFERAAGINARKAAFRAQVPEGCTFAPAINARRVPAEEAPSSSPVGARLHALATAKQHAATLRVEGGAGQEVFSFSPVLLTRRPKPASMSAAAQAAAVTAAVDVAAALRSKRAAAVAAASNAAKAAAHPTLTAKAAALVRRGSVGERLYGLAAVQRHVAAQPPPVPAECTFSPRVNAGVPPAVKARFAQAEAAGRAEGKASPPSAGAAAASPHERLYRSSTHRETARIALAAEVNASAMRECTFSPRLGSGGSRTVGRLYGSKEELLEELLLPYSRPLRKKELLVARTGAVATSGSGPVSAGSRLHSAAMERAARLVASVAQAAAAVDPEATFSPALSPTSRRIVANIREEEGGREEDVGARLYEGGRAAIAARAVAAAAPTAGLTSDTVRELTFQPRINANAYREEDGVHVHERLYRLGRRASGGGGGEDTEE